MNDDKQQDSFEARVYQIVAMIPYGKVMTYGEVAKQAGFTGYARHVGYVLRHLPRSTKLPWYRVINHQGKIVLQERDYWRQKDALIKEGIEFSKADRINLKVYGWKSC